MKQCLILLFVSFFLFIPYCSSVCLNCEQPEDCFRGTETTICNCQPEYETHPRDSTDQCNYQRKKQWISFILETVVAFGAGHFYAGNYARAVPKLIVWIIAWTLFGLMRVISVKREIEDPLALVYALWSFIFCSIIIVWYIADVVMIGLNRYRDGNGIEMIYW